MISCLLVLSGVRSSSVDTNDDRAPFLFYATPLRTADEEIAARFAPVFYQALGDKPRSDYITNFDFDGDWRADILQLVLLEFLTVPQEHPCSCGGTDRPSGDAASAACEAMS